MLIGGGTTLLTQLGLLSARIIDTPLHHVAAAECPTTSKNFLKLCKLKYYNNALFYNVQQDFILQCGDPTGTGRGGSSVDGLLYGEQARFFDGEIRPDL